MKKIVQWMLGDCGYYSSYARCPSRFEKLRRWLGYRVGILPNKWRPHAENQQPLAGGKDVGTLVRDTRQGSSGVGGSGLRYIQPGELITEDSQA